MIDFETLSPDAPAIILLCSSIGTDRGAAAKPLGPRTWAKLVERVGRPGDLVGLTPEAIDRSFGVGADDAARIASLPGRGGQLAFELDRLRSRGIWVVRQNGCPAGSRKTRQRSGSGWCSALVAPASSAAFSAASRSCAERSRWYCLGGAPSGHSGGS